LKIAVKRSEAAIKDMNKVLAIIPARAGSKGLPGKNLRSFNGKPLIQWTIEAALKVQGISQVTVTSDDESILNLARNIGATAHKRSEYLSTDLSQASEVIEDAVRHFPDFTTLIYLQPTSPLRKSFHIENALNMYDTKIRIPIVSVSEVTQPPEWMYTLGLGGRLFNYLDSTEIRRQDAEQKYIPNGAIYIADVNFLREDGFVFSKSNPLPYIMDFKSSIDIDNQMDFDLAEWITKNSDD
jgi:CMP-N-acetylneuraminic acid synthetase